MPDRPPAVATPAAADAVGPEAGPNPAAARENPVRVGGGGGKGAGAWGNRWLGVGQAGEEWRRRGGEAAFGQQWLRRRRVRPWVLRLCFEKGESRADEAAGVVNLRRGGGSQNSQCPAACLAGAHITGYSQHKALCLGMVYSHDGDLDLFVLFPTSVHCIFFCPATEFHYYPPLRCPKRPAAFGFAPVMRHFDRLAQSARGQITRIALPGAAIIPKYLKIHEDMIELQLMLCSWRPIHFSNGTSNTFDYDATISNISDSINLIWNDKIGDSKRCLGCIIRGTPRFRSIHI
jgi:hypothetical protein